MANNASESSSLLNPQKAGSAASAGLAFAHETAEQIKQTRRGWPLTFRALGFLGGLAMIVSNSFMVFSHFFHLRFAGAFIAVYNILFGVAIAALETPGPCNRSIQGVIRHNARFLDYTRGRGALYFFCGTLQIGNWNMLDWIVGGYMMFIGVIAILVGTATARHLRLLKFSLADKDELKQKWKEHDVDGDGKLDVKELTSFVNDAGVEMSRNEIAAVFLTLDRNFDGRISYEELYDWWASDGTYGGGNV